MIPSVIASTKSSSAGTSICAYDGENLIAEMNGAGAAAPPAFLVGRGSDMAINRVFGILALTAGPLLLSFTCVLNGASSSDQIRSVAISPDGKLVAVDIHKGTTSFIYKIEVESGVATRLTDAKDGGESSPAFSPDGKRIAYAYQPSDHRRSRIVIVNIDGSNPHQWSPSAVNDFSPVFSPDGKTVIFCRSVYYGSASPIAQAHPHAWDFYVSDSDGKNLRQLTDEAFYMASPVSISTDGKSMVVVTETLKTNAQIAIHFAIERSVRLRSGNVLEVAGNQPGQLEKSFHGCVTGKRGTDVALP